MSQVRLEFVIAAALVSDDIDRLDSAARTTLGPDGPGSCLPGSHRSGRAHIAPSGSLERKNVVTFHIEDLFDNGSLAACRINGDQSVFEFKVSPRS